MGQLLRLIVSVLVAIAVTAPAAGAARPLQTGFADAANFGNASRQAGAFDRARAAGASFVRLVLNWRAVAPVRRPARFDATNPAEPAYAWGPFDREVRLASARGLEPLVTVALAPAWAEGRGAGPQGTVRPSPAHLGQFARAAARRYSGDFGALPRVRYWQVWNEPNRDYYLRPQYVRGRMFSAGWYRRMVESFAANVHVVSGANRVVAGGLAPLGRPGKPAPLAFMRRMLCVARGRRSCDLRRNPVDLDVWSHHPYTSGGPVHRATHRDDVALGDLPEMRRLLRIAVRLGHVRSRGPVGFWVTEFSWDSKPPDPAALAARLHARWVSEALYRMWRNGVSVVIWFKIRDDPLAVSPYQSGLWTTNWRPKHSLTAFRFPVVAFARRGGVAVWGRTPTSGPGAVLVELKTGSTWRTLGTLTANENGIFARRYVVRARRGSVRARFGAEQSLAFSLTHVRDRFVNPFGCGGPIACR
jgi:hypothetical protein